ncbi:alpha-1,3-arabinosyltransferase XAT3-like [Dendrobium catenatum]|uniref:Glycosyltransferase 61 catalytic domain-containing protein n=1 Tax=Dendrobium catenatum TaxID=906689 RepID=A0A2I0WC93_9ASPA|nr:alpha-1,3-arabinosyltransferase XAT3-like [Dendrobium catenatum]PKU73268.1 hypothetical protein MA16_Dca022080 [Dendrobium catenatum]
MAKNHRFVFSEQHSIPASADYSGNRKAPSPLLRFFFLSFFAVTFIILCSSTILHPFFYFPVTEAESQILNRASSSLCSFVINNSICCDRSAFRTDICFLHGDVRTHSLSNTIFLQSVVLRQETIRPYTRKWEKTIMAIVSELRLLAIAGPTVSCDIVHPFPAVVFSTGGYTGNVFHEFNDGIIPLYLTAHHHNRDVVLLILDHHNWWVSRYAEILSRISRFPPINFSNDSRTHCFPSATVGLHIHDDLTIDPTQTPLNNSIIGFRQFLDDAYAPRLRWLEVAEKTNLVLVLRNGSRTVENEGDLVAMATEMGFRVGILRPEKTTELASIYRVMNGSDVMIGVHGAAMTHFLFMRPGAVFVQIIPLGTEWAAETYYGAPARRMGLRYVAYKVRVEESSLWREYGREHPVVREPGKINARGWEETKRVYLDRQNVSLDLGRFRRTLEGVRRYLDGGRLRRPEEAEEETERRQK